MTIKITFIVFVALAQLHGWYDYDGSQDDIRYLMHNGSKVKTTYKVDKSFIGKYKGKKEGFLLLDADGSGVYKYDMHGFSRGDCKGGEVRFNWGFILDENDSIVRFDRPYGFSYPVIFVSLGESGFQDCKRKSMIEYLLVRKDQTIAVSSSDDWLKSGND